MKNSSSPVNAITVGGVVEDVRLNFTVLRTASDQRVIIPNEKMASSVLRNDTLGYVWQLDEGTTTRNASTTRLRVTMRPRVSAR